MSFNLSLCFNFVWFPHFDIEDQLFLALLSYNILLLMQDVPYDELIHFVLERLILITISSYP